MHLLELNIIASLSPHIFSPALLCKYEKLFIHRSPSTFLSVFIGMDWPYIRCNLFLTIHLCNSQVKPNLVSYSGFHLNVEK